MAKNKKKTSAGAETSAAGSSKSKDASGENFISFDASTLASLTQNIEARLKGGADKNSKKNKNNGTSEKKGPKEFKSPTSKPHGEGKAEEAKPVGTSRPPQKSSSQGKKRDRNGAVIGKVEKVENVGKGKVQKTKLQADNDDDDAGDNEDDVLRKEILALGGSKEDFDLLAGVDSGSEVEDSAQKKTDSNEDALRKELAKLLKGAGQYQAEIPDDEVSEQEEEEEEEETTDQDIEQEDQDLSSEAEKSAAKDTSKKSVAEPQQNTFPKEYSRLVSFSNRSKQIALSR